MVRVRVRVRVRVPTGKRQWTPERNANGRTHGSASSGGAKA
jgi:hypothetical protein